MAPTAPAHPPDEPTIGEETIEELLLDDRGFLEPENDERWFHCLGLALRGDARITADGKLTYPVWDYDPRGGRLVVHDPPAEESWELTVEEAMESYTFVPPVDFDSDEMIG